MVEPAFEQLTHMHKNRLYIKIAAILGAASVSIGAFGSHLLRDLLTPQTAATWQTAVSYQFHHALAILGIGILYKRYHSRAMVNAARFMVGGIVLFSGSLYISVLLTLSGRPGLGLFAFVTPVGGVMLILGWVCLVFGIPGSVIRSEPEED